jgi:hypothetical protein
LARAHAIDCIGLIHAIQRASAVTFHPDASKTSLHGELLEWLLLMVVGVKLEDIEHGFLILLVVFAGDGRSGQELEPLFGHALWVHHTIDISNQSRWYEHMCG